MSDKPVRVRFAPSPTGYLHIGGARTALMNWLFARHSGGRFILRIEDTDQNRYTEDAVQRMMADLRWLGLEWDEGPDLGGPYGPYVQSERLPLYQNWAQWLVEQGKAYYDYSTPEELERARELARASKQNPVRASRLHRHLSEAERARYAAERGSGVIRFAMPLEGKTTTQDEVRGSITVENADLPDAVLLKSDGFPTYHLAMAVDDHFMEISHVMRSEEWIPSLPLHQHLYEAFGWEVPLMVHLPVVLNPDGRGKLSKRKPPVDAQGQPIPVMVGDYREAGYLPEALLNFLTNVGYNFGDDREIFTVQETIQRFDLTRINPSSGAFPVSKLEWINGEYIREMEDEAFSSAALPFLEAAYGSVDAAQLRAIAPHVKVRVNPLTQVVPMLQFLFDFQPSTVEALIQKKMDAASTRLVLQAAHERLSALADFSAAAQEASLRAYVEESGYKVGQVFGSLRQAVTGQKVSPPLFESIEVLGKAEALRRINEALRLLESAA